ncbi:MAG TPA: hypothetical protein VD903_20800 [Pseudonocardia sp.]|jgi:hypothetical protein|nr:hypothetical protein [Pseudonocardia sp.]
MPPLRALAAVAALTICTGCSMTDEAPAPAAVVPVTVPCAETEATPIADRPPVLAATTRPWFGQDDLWVGLPDYPPDAQGDALVLRFPMVTLAQGAPTDERGAPVVTAERADSAGEAPGRVGVYSRAYGTDALSFWPVSVVFPDPGCWTVSGLLGTASLQFTVSVERP